MSVLPVKGRRRARRLALQALYELDQSEHPLPRVLELRVVAFLEEHVPRHVPGASRADGERWARLLAPSLLDPERDGLVPEAESERARKALTAIADQAAYGVRLVRGVVASRAALDEAIAVIAPEWPVDQMAPVDRNLLRIALWEIATESSPERVAISEAVELAREFSGEGARRMVNGALGAYASGDHPLSLAGEDEDAS